MKIKTESSIITNKELYNSYFDKSKKAFVITMFKFYLMVIFTIGLAAPWAICMKQKATAHHTVISGKRMKFIGQPVELAGHWFIWWLLTIVTIGIYGLFVKLRMEKWITANTIFEDVEVIDVKEKAEVEGKEKTVIETDTEDETEEPK